MIAVTIGYAGGQIAFFALTLALLIYWTILLLRRNQEPWQFDKTERALGVVLAIVVFIFANLFVSQGRGEAEALTRDLQRQGFAHSAISSIDTQAHTVMLRQPNGESSNYRYGSINGTYRVWVKHLVSPDDLPKGDS